MTAGRGGCRAAGRAWTRPCLWHGCGDAAGSYDLRSRLASGKYDALSSATPGFERATSVSQSYSSALYALGLKGQAVRFDPWVQTTCVIATMASMLLFVTPSRSMSIVGRETGACHAVNIKAPLSTNLSAYGDLARRYKNRSMAKYCNISLNGWPVSRALLSKRCRMDTARFASVRWFTARPPGTVA